MSALTVSDKLFAYIKPEVGVTWDDDATDTQLKNQIRRGMAYIIDKTGVTASAFSVGDDEANERALELLVNYVRYDRAGSVDQFKTQYQSDIVGLRNRWEVANYEAKTTG